ncbi:GGDEF domain-containing protein, partial [Acinetobacter baumannii]
GVVVALFVAGTNDYFRRTHYAIAAARAPSEAARAAEDRERARYLVRHDPLTELLNRDALIADLDGEIGARPDHAFDLVVVNLDRF